VIVDADKNVTVEVGVPPTASLILKELGIEKGSTEDEVVGDLSIEQVLRIARMKKDDVLSYTLRNASKEIIGTCVPMGITVAGMPPKDAQQAIDSGEIEIPDEW